MCIRDRSTYIVQRALGDNVALNIAFEQELFESLISASSTPESSILNLLTALAVMPMAAFTTLAVLGGGAGKPPSWMQPSSSTTDNDEVQEQLDTLSASLDQLAAEVNQQAAPEPRSVHTPAMVQHVVVPVVQTLPSSVETPPPPMEQDTSSLVDDLDFDRLAASLAAAQEGSENQSFLLYTSPSPRDQRGSRMPSSA